MSGKARSKDWHWDRYWHADRTASCFDSEAGSYGGGVREFWEDWFSKRLVGARVLDLCTGNGALPLIAYDISVKRDLALDLVAIDRAMIDPATYVTGHDAALSAIAFHPGIAADNLPFDDGSFDCVTSQYGAEYTPLARTLSEAVRVLRPAGEICLVMHAAEGKVAVGARDDLKWASFLLDELDVISKAIIALKAAKRADQAAPTRHKAHQKRAETLAVLDSALRAIQSAAAQAHAPQMLATSLHLIQHTYEVRTHFDIGTLVTKMEELETEIGAHGARSQALVNAAQSAVQMEGSAEALRRAGMVNAKIGEVKTEQSNLCGWVLSAVKPS